MKPTKANCIPGFEQLEAMPRLLGALIAGSSKDQQRWKPSPGRWSILEVLGHLAHVEEHGFRGRAERILAENNPLLENYDPDVFCAAGAYTHPDAAAALAAYERERTRSLDLLREIRREQLERRAIHGSLGPITLGNLLNEWPLHDLGHLRQISELLRARRFFPHIGAWQRYYSMNP